MIRQAVQSARERGLIAKGDTVVIPAGAALSEPGTTNLMRVHVIGDERCG